MGQKESKAIKRNISQIKFQRRVQSGDLVLIAQTSTIQTDLVVPPQLAHMIRFNIKHHIATGYKKQYGIWNAAGIIVDLQISNNSGKALLQLTQNGFQVSELLGRVLQFKRKGHKIAVRFLQGKRSNDFRKQLKEMADFLGGKTLDQLVGTEIYRSIRRRVDLQVENTERNKEYLKELKKAFFITVTDADQMSINKHQLHDMIREISGARMDVNPEFLADSLRLGDEISYEDFKEAWVNKLFKPVLMEEHYEPSLLAGQFLRYVYEKMGMLKVVKVDSSEEGEQVLTPDDFATSLDEHQTFKNTNLQIGEDYYMEHQLIVSIQSFQVFLLDLNLLLQKIIKFSFCNKIS